MNGIMITGIGIGMIVLAVILFIAAIVYRKTTGKRKISQCVLIVFLLMAVLSGCGGADGNKKDEREMVSSTENNQREDRAGADTGEKTETEKKEDTGDDCGKEEADVKQQEIADWKLEDVIWEDFNDGVGEPLLHFSFSNGKVVDIKLQYMGVVRKIDYRDITGDGADEVIVYTDFINTVHDDYILLDFFKIEGDTVTDISPVADIPELADIAWDSDISEDASNNYTIVLNMESYGKTSGVLYTDCMMTVGYDGSGWKVIQKQERPEWKKVYLDYLVINTEAFTSDICRFWLVYVDDDEIPELFYYADDAQFIVSLLVCEDGKVKEVTEFGGQGASLWYQERAGNLLVSGAMMGNTSYSGFYFENGELQDGLYAWSDIPPDMDESLAVYYWGDETVSKEEYHKRFGDVAARMTHQITLDNGIEFDELWGILGSVGDVIDTNQTALISQ